VKWTQLVVAAGVVWAGATLHRLANRTWLEIAGMPDKALADVARSPSRLEGVWRLAQREGEPLPTTGRHDRWWFVWIDPEEDDDPLTWSARFGDEDVTLRWFARRAEGGEAVTLCGTGRRSDRRIGDVLGHGTADLELFVDPDEPGDDTWDVLRLSLHEPPRRLTYLRVGERD